MKKLLLASALGVALAANAGSPSDYFTVTYQGETLENGATVIANHIKDLFQIGFEEPPIITNILSTPYQAEITLYAVDPTYENYDRDELGMIQLCPAKGCLQMCLGATDGNFAHYDFPFPAKQFVDIDAHLSYMKVLMEEGAEIPTDLLVKTKLVFSVVDDPEAEFVLFMDFSGDPNYGGVDALVSNNGKTEYFNLQGTRVANPEKGGLYIVRQGGKVTKQIIK